MTKGIRQYASSRFNELLPTVREAGPTLFRRKIMQEIVKKFDTSVASAAAAYNFALQQVKKENPKAVAGIGRGSLQYANTTAGAGPGKAAGAARGAATRAAQEQRAGAADEAARVTIIKARSGEVVFKDLPRDAAQALLNSMGQGGRGRPKLAIKEDVEMQG
jgi:hypothetical protein